MSARVVATRAGGPEVLEVVEQTVGEPGPGQVKVDVRAAGVNPVDWKVYSGQMGEQTFPRGVGSEAAGVVTAVGDGAEGMEGPVHVGDEVIVFRAPGSYAAELLVDADAVVQKPAGMPFEEAAGLMLTGVTAVHMLEATKVPDDQTVLVHGGSGGVGLVLLQLLAARSATVIATCAAENDELVRSFGATPIAYGEGLLERARAAADHYDVALDCVGTQEALDVSLALVEDRSRIATIANFGAGGTGIKVLGGGPGADPGDEIRREARLHLTKAVEHGTLRVVVARTYPLAEAAAANAFSKDGHPAGKVVLTV